MVKRRLLIVTAFLIAFAFLFNISVYAAEPLDEVKGLIQNKYLNDVGEDVLGKTSVQEMVYALNDPYSNYIKPDNFQDFLSSLDGKYVGVGMYIQQVKDSCQVISPMKGSSAEKAGIKSGDIITHVDGNTITGLTSSEVAAKIRGLEGTKVSVTVKRGKESLTFSMTRQTISITSVEYRLIGPEVGYITLDGFNSESPEEMDQALDDLIAQHAELLVLDLRNNPGGLLDVAVAISGEFVAKGPVVHVIQKSNREYTLKSNKVPRGLPVAVLVNGGTASASEILAGAIQDAKTGIIVGTNTFGKGCVQTVFTLSNGGGLKLTTAKYLTRGRQDINLKGITPDIIESDENKQMERAVNSLGTGIKLYDLQVTVDSPIAFAGYRTLRLSENPFMQGGTVMVPLRNAAVALGAEVVWKSGKASVVSSKGKIVVDMKNKKITIPVSNRVIKGSPIEKNGQIMVPVRALAESLGYKTIWQAPLKSAAITH